MATKKICDFCLQEIQERNRHQSAVIKVFQRDNGQELLAKDACADCHELIRRLLGKDIVRLARALGAANDPR